MTEATCFQEIDILVKVAIQPLHTSHPMDAVRQQLNNSLFNYNEKMQGVPLSFSDLRFPKGKEYGRLLIDQPWIHVDVLTKLVVFVPAVGSKIEGKIVKVLLVVCNMFETGV